MDETVRIRTAFDSKNSVLCGARTWYAIHTRPRQEKLVDNALGGKGYETFLPLCKRRRRWSDRIKELEVPLLPGYLFCRLDLGERRLPVLTTPGVREIVGIAGTPVAVSCGEIEAVRAVVASGLAASPWPFLRIGHRVRIHGGALAGVEGILVASKKGHRLVITVELLQRSVAVDVDEAWVESIQPASCPALKLKR
jgi:transcription antitermination factor NusG